MEKTNAEKKQLLSTEEINYYVKIIQDPQYDNSEEKEEAYEKILNNLQNFIIYILRRSFSTYLENYHEDMIQECRLAVIQCLQRYDPTKAALTTWVKPWIEHSAQDCINTINQNTSYYNKNLKIIQDFEKKCEMEGVPCSDFDIAENINLSLKTIRACRERNQRLCSLDTFDENIAENKVGPEMGVIAQEESENLKRALNHLPDLQRQIVLLRYGFYGAEFSPMKISECLDVKKEVVIRNLNAAKATLRNYFKREHLFMDREIRQEIDVYKELLSTIPKDTEETSMEVQIFLDSLEMEKNSDEASLDEIKQFL